MIQWVISLCIILTFSTLEESGIIYRFLTLRNGVGVEASVESITAMEALDLIKEQYAINFEKIAMEDTEEEYYYKLPLADYYLVYEGYGETDQDYIIHLYEFVLDDPETGRGHTVTYGWYTVNRNTHEISIQSYDA